MSFVSNLSTLYKQMHYLNFHKFIVLKKISQKEHLKVKVKIIDENRNYYKVIIMCNQFKKAYHVERRNFEYSEDCINVVKSL